MSFMMDCFSGISQSAAAGSPVKPRRALLGEIMDFPVPDVCDAWGNPDLVARFSSAGQVNPFIVIHKRHAGCAHHLSATLKFGKAFIIASI